MSAFTKSGFSSPKSYLAPSITEKVNWVPFWTQIFRGWIFFSRPDGWTYLLTQGVRSLIRYTLEWNMRVYTVLHRFVIDGHSMGPKVCSTTQILITMEATKPCTAHPSFADASNATVIYLHLQFFKCSSHGVFLLQKPPYMRAMALTHDRHWKGVIQKIDMAHLALDQLWYLQKWRHWVWDTINWWKIL